MADANIQLNILVVDDEPDVLHSVSVFLEDQGHCVCLADGGRQGLRCLQEQAFDIVITDIKMPDVDGFAVLGEVRRSAPDTEVIMITGFRDLENALRAMREGAFDFFAKPLRVEDLDASLRRTVRSQTLRRDRDRVQERLVQMGAEARQRYGLDAIVGSSAAMEKIREQVMQVAQATTMTVLVQGETGTGKELVAHAVHYESDRAVGPFVAVDCSATPDSLAESVFFGHVKGAFTDARGAHKGYFEQAHGGTIFLDEIGDMDPAIQSKLLRTLETRRIRPLGGEEEIEVDVRVVSATHRNLVEAIGEGTFRQDLYYRLNALTIHIPPLRERPDDILPLAQHFLDRYVREMRNPLKGFTPAAVEQFQAHSFSGNVRELRNLIERATILCQTNRITEEDLAFDLQGQSAEMLESTSPELAQADRQRAIQTVATSELTLSDFEADVIREALRRFGGNQGRAARALGISRHMLARRMKRYDIRRETFTDFNSE